MDRMKDMATWNEGDWIAALAAVFLFAVLAVGGLIAARKSEEVVGHPRGLFVLFYAEMWERFSYYGMRGILVFYLTQHLLFDQATAGRLIRRSTCSGPRSPSSSSARASSRRTSR
jgi:POT family proton-dependent oligopeptide transporter